MKNKTINDKISNNEKVIIINKKIITIYEKLHKYQFNS